MFALWHYRFFTEEGIKLESKQAKIDEKVCPGRSFLRMCGLMEKDDDDLE